MTVYPILIGLCWIVFIGYWLISAFSAKRTIKRSWWGLLIRAGSAIAVVLLFQIHSVNQLWIQSTASLANPLVASLGVLLCALGVAFAVWARVYLGKNWGMPMSLKENPELVTGGPYAYVRNPIYTGVLLAMLGTALVFGLFWLALAIFIGIYFVYSAKVEEKIMLKAFPDTYPAYKKRTKMLVPFVL